MQSPDPYISSLVKQLAIFVKTTTLGGLVLLLPGVLLLMVAGNAVSGVRTAVELIMHKLAGPNSGAAHFPMIFAVLVVIILSFIFGLILTLPFGKRTQEQIEGTLIGRVPGYAAMRSIIHGLANTGNDGTMKPALLTGELGIQSLVLVTNDDGGDRVTIFVPDSPNPGAGSVQFVPRELVMPLNIRVTEMAALLRQFGVDSPKLFAKHATRSKGHDLPNDPSPFT